VNEQLRIYRDTREGQRKREAEASKVRYFRLKQEAITILGGKCLRCGCDDMRCLEIDHIVPVRGDRSVYGVKLYRSVTHGNTENLQVLCANCHAIKTYEDGNE
jgi:5-methylcytosine-specific restriction endonuclease McrA